MKPGNHRTVKNVLQHILIAVLIAALLFSFPYPGTEGGNRNVYAAETGAALTSLTVKSTDGEKTAITDFTADDTSGWTASEGRASGWKYDAAQGYLVLSGGENGIALGRISAKGDLTIATAGVVSVEQISVDGKLTIIGAGIVVCDAIGATGGVYCDTASFFLQDEDGAYYLRTAAAVLDENAVLPGGKDYAIPGGASLTLAVTLGEAGAFTTTQLTVPGSSTLRICKDGALAIEAKTVSVTTERGEETRLAFCSLQANGGLTVEQGAAVSNAGKIYVRGSLNDAALIDCTSGEGLGYLYLDTAATIGSLLAKNAVIGLGGSADTVSVGSLTLDGTCIIGSEGTGKNLTIGSLDAQNADVTFSFAYGIPEVTVDGTAAFRSLKLASYLLRAAQVSCTDSLTLDIGYIETPGSCTVGGSAVYDLFGSVPERCGFIDAGQSVPIDTEEEGIPFTLSIASANASYETTYNELHEGLNGLQREYTDAYLVTAPETFNWDTLWALIDFSTIPEEELLGNIIYYTYDFDELKVYDVFLVHVLDGGVRKTVFVERDGWADVTADQVLGIDALLAHVEPDAQAGSTTISGASAVTGSGILGGASSGTLLGTSGSSRILAGGTVLEDDDPDDNGDDPDDNGDDPDDNGDDPDDNGDDPDDNGDDPDDNGDDPDDNGDDPDDNGDDPDDNGDDPDDNGDDPDDNGDDPDDNGDAPDDNGDAPDDNGNTPDEEKGNSDQGGSDKGSAQTDHQGEKPDSFDTAGNTETTASDPVKKADKPGTDKNKTSAGSPEKQKETEASAPEKDTPAAGEAAAEPTVPEKLEDVPAKDGIPVAIPAAAGLGLLAVLLFFLKRGKKKED